MIQEQFQIAICPSQLKFILIQKRINKHLQHSRQNPEMWLGSSQNKGETAWLNQCRRSYTHPYHVPVPSESAIPVTFLLLQGQPRYSHVA